MRICLFPGAVHGTVAAPPSKSMAHRALICAALAQGTSQIIGLASSQDMLATQDALRLLGAKLMQNEHGLFVTGARSVPFSALTQPVPCRESGSTLRFLIPLFSLTGAAVQLTGEGRLPQRPQSVYEALFLEKGLSFVQNEQGVLLHGALPAGEYTLNGSISSQFVTGLLFALPLLDCPSTVHITPPFESRSYANLTLQALSDFGVHASWQDDVTLSIPAPQTYKPCVYKVEGDYSQAAFFAVLGAVLGQVHITGLRLDSLQGDKAILDILKRCGAQFSANDHELCFFKSDLHATVIDLADCPDLGPILMVLGLFCTGETVLTNAGRLRIKESDRIAAMESEIRKMGGEIRSEGDTVFVRSGMLHAAQNLDSHNDHRIVMAMSIAALGAGVPVVLHGAQAVEKSYPNFFSDLASLGAKVEQDETA